MKVKVTKSWLWAEDGINAREVRVGDVLEGRGASIALELKSGELVAETAPAARPAPEPEPVDEPIPAVEQPVEPKRHKKGR